MSVSEGSGIDGFAYKNSDGKWEAKAMALSTLSGVNINSGTLAPNNVLQYVLGR